MTDISEPGILASLMETVSGVTGVSHQEMLSAIAPSKERDARDIALLLLTVYGKFAPSTLRDFFERGDVEILASMRRNAVSLMRVGQRGAIPISPKALTEAMWREVRA